MGGVGERESSLSHKHFGFSRKNGFDVTAPGYTQMLKALTTCLTQLSSHRKIASHENSEFLERLAGFGLGQSLHYLSPSGGGVSPHSIMGTHYVDGPPSVAHTTQPQA